MPRPGSLPHQGQAGRREVVHTAMAPAARCRLHARHGQEAADPAPAPPLPARPPDPGPARCRATPVRSDRDRVRLVAHRPRGQAVPARELARRRICQAPCGVASGVLRQPGRAHGGHRRRAGDLRRVRGARPRGRAGLRRPRLRDPPRADRARRRPPRPLHRPRRPAAVLQGCRGRLEPARDPRPRLPRRAGRGRRDGARRGAGRGRRVPPLRDLDVAALRRARRAGARHGHRRRASRSRRRGASQRCSASSATGCPPCWS